MRALLDEPDRLWRLRSQPDGAHGELQSVNGFSGTFVATKGSERYAAASEIAGLFAAQASSCADRVDSQKCEA
jgi:hypothetical protein